MLRLLKSNSSCQVLSYKGYDFIVLSTLEMAKQINPEDFQGYVLQSAVDALEIIRYIRGLDAVTDALKPLFFHTEISSLSKEIKIHCDGGISQQQLPMIVERVRVIQSRIDQIKSKPIQDYEATVQEKLFGYLFSRNKFLTPVTTRVASCGYLFPFLSLFFSDQETLSLLTFLNKQTQQGYLTATLVDQVHLCKSCHGNYLNFRECCPSCSSFDISSQDMVHHFVCAHVAPISDFQHHDKEGLHCPKCDHTLRHIGIDYDKPSSVYCCNTCSHEFQDVVMQAFCFDCETSNQLQELVSQEINEHALSQKAQQYLKTVSNSNNIRIEKETLLERGVQTLYFFELILKQEILRLQTTKESCMYARIEISNTAFSILNDLAKLAFHQELLGIISSYLNTTDILSSESIDQYHLVLPCTSFKQLDRLETVEYNLNKLLKDNFQQDTIRVQVKIHPLSHLDYPKELMVC